jgi:hypothetical protein
MVRYSAPIVLFISIFLVFYGCKKAQEPGIPVVQIIEPQENDIFAVKDTIRIEANISDENIIQNVKVVLTDTSFQPVMEALYYYPGSTSYQLETDYIIQDKNLSTSDYFLLVKADNGTNFKNKYQKIFIEGIEREFEKLILVTQKNANQMKVLEVKGNQPPNFLFDIPGDYASSDINSRNRQLYLAGKNKINLIAIDIDSYEVKWNLPPEPPLPIHAENCLFFDESIFTSFYSYYIKGYRDDGLEIFNTLAVDPELPSLIFRHNDLLIADLQNKSGGVTYIATFYLASGVEKQRIFSDFRVTGFHSIDEEQILIVANKFTEGLLKLYDPYLNEFTHLKDFEQNIISSEKIDAINFLIGLEDKVVLYNRIQNTISDLLSGIEPYRIRYDDLNSDIYLAGAKEVRIFSYPTFQELNSFFLTDSLLNIHLLYNK